MSLVFVAVCSVFWLFWLSCHYLPSDWLERLLWRSLIMVRGSRPRQKSTYDFLGLLYCFIVLFYFMFYNIWLLAHDNNNSNCFIMYLCCFLPLRDIFSYFYGAIYPICADWLERLLWGSLTVARGSSPQSPGWRWFSWFIVLSCLPALHNTFHTSMARYSLFVLKVPLNTSQLTN